MDRACVLGMPANLAKDAVSLNGKMILLRARTCTLDTLASGKRLMGRVEKDIQSRLWCS